MSRLTPLHLIAFILFLLLLVLASNVKAAPEATGHASAGVCDYMDTNGVHYHDPAQCPDGWCCEDCGDGCYNPPKPPPTTPTTEPERPTIIIIDGGAGE